MSPEGLLLGPLEEPTDDVEDEEDDRRNLVRNTLSCIAWGHIWARARVIGLCRVRGWDEGWDEGWDGAAASRVVGWRVSRAVSRALNVMRSTVGEEVLRYLHVRVQSLVRLG